VRGRELRQGCLIPTVGGGLCQLSNALYDCALKAGLTIEERHAHTQVVPGSLAEIGRDATVFWNYVDLRFRSEHGFVLRVDLTPLELIVQLWEPR
jgi:vancomycin resistance protein YoaR